jgi:hypothetical protein
MPGYLVVVRRNRSSRFFSVIGCVRGGIVKNGVVVPQNDIPLPDGAHVDILISPADVTPALKSELERWDKASDEAWAMIDQWEAEER